MPVYRFYGRYARFTSREWRYLLFPLAEDGIVRDTLAILESNALANPIAFPRIFSNLSLAWNANMSEAFNIPPIANFSSELMTFAQYESYMPVLYGLERIPYCRRTPLGVAVFDFPVKPSAALADFQRRWIMYVDIYGPLFFNSGSTVTVAPGLDTTAWKTSIGYLLFYQYCMSGYDPNYKAATDEFLALYSELINFRVTEQLSVMDRFATWYDDGNDSVYNVDLEIQEWFALMWQEDGSPIDSMRALMSILRNNQYPNSQISYSEFRDLVETRTFEIKSSAHSRTGGIRNGQLRTSFRGDDVMQGGIKMTFVVASTMLQRWLDNATSSVQDIRIGDVASSSSSLGGGGFSEYKDNIDEPGSIQQSASSSSASTMSLGGLDLSVDDSSIGASNGKKQRGRRRGGADATCFTTPAETNAVRRTCIRIDSGAGLPTSMWQHSFNGHAKPIDWNLRISDIEKIAIWLITGRTLLSLGRSLIGRGVTVPFERISDTSTTMSNFWRKYLKKPNETAANRVLQIGDIELQLVIPNPRNPENRVLWEIGVRVERTEISLKYKPDDLMKLTRQRLLKDASDALRHEVHSSSTAMNTVTPFATDKELQQAIETSIDRYGYARLPVRFQRMSAPIEQLIVTENKLSKSDRLKRLEVPTMIDAGVDLLIRLY